MHDTKKSISTPFFLYSFSLVFLMIFIVKLNIAYIYEINWDEFYFLSKVHDYLRGELTKGLQTFHVHFFTWLPLVSENEVDQIIAARFLMVGLQTVTAVFLFRVSRFFFQKTTACFVVVIYFSIEYVLLLGGDFRVDPIVTCISIIALDLALKKQKNNTNLIVIGVLVGLALILTIKAAFYVPVIGIIFLVNAFVFKSYKPSMYQLFLVAISIMVTFCVLYILHRSSLGEISEGAKSIISSSFEKTIASPGLFPRWHYFMESIQKDIVFWVLFFVGFLFLLKEIVVPKILSREKSCKLMGMAFPVLTFIFYRNAFPYYYSFALVSASLLAAILWENLLLTKKRRIGTAINGLILIYLGSNILYVGLKNPFYKNMHHQKEMLVLIHELFPEPVSYIDRCSMVSSFPKKGFFMSSWGLENYRENNKPIFKEIIKNSQPAFLLANRVQLQLGFKESVRHKFIPRRYDLFDEDIDVLEENYIPHWGSLYVAGKHIILRKPEVGKEFSVMVAGIYTLEAKGSVYLDGEKLEVGETVYLEKGVHNLKAGNKGIYTFRWGDNLKTPTFAQRNNSLFNGF